MLEISNLIRKQKWILTELGYLNMLGVVGALGFLGDALQSKIGTIFISQTSGTDIGNKVSALFLGQVIIVFTFYVVAQGIGGGMCILCSQAYGAANYKLMGTYFMRTLMISSLTFFPIWTILISVKPVIYSITLNTELAEGAGGYTTILCFCYPAYIYSRLACSFLQSQNIVFPILVIQVSGNLLNICLQYVFVVIFSLGIKGTALSYVISTFLIAILLYAYIRFTSSHLTYSMFSWSYLAGWYHFLEYSSVTLAQLLINVTASRMVPLILIGFVLRNTNQLALLGIFSVVWFLFYTVGYGLGTGAGVRVGNLLGKNDLTRAKQSAVLFIIFAFIVEIFFQILVISLSHYISYLFTSLPDFRKQIEFGLRIVSLCTFSDVLYTSRGICNACCLQARAIVGQLPIMILATSLGCVLAYFIQWQAAGYYLVLAIGLSFCCFYNILILYLSNWEVIARKVSQNTHINGLTFSVEDSSQLLFSRAKKIILFSRYLIILLSGFIVFALVVIAFHHY